ncbi:MAG TPA: hypothetical protein VF030_06885 [Solirubrobacterales bacterium]
MSLWIRVEAAIADSAKVWEFAGMLLGTGSAGASAGVDAESPRKHVAESIGYLVQLWGKVADKRETGDVSDVPDGLLESWAGWAGPRGHFAHCFRSVFASDGQINDWQEHQGKLIERRKKERARWLRRHSAGGSAEATPESVRDSASTPVANGNGNGIKKEIPATLERRVKRQVIGPDAQAVIDHYRRTHPKRLRGAIPEKVLRLLRSALKSYPAADLCRAIDGNAASQFHRDGGHLGLDLILRDASKIDYFLDLAQKADAQSVEMTDDMGEMRLHTKRDGWWGYERDGEWVRTVEVGQVSA